VRLNDWQRAGITVSAVSLLGMLLFGGLFAWHQIHDIPSFLFSDCIISSDQDWNFCQMQYSEEIAQRSTEVWEDLVPFGLMSALGGTIIAWAFAFAVASFCNWIARGFRRQKLRDAPLNTVLARAVSPVGPGWGSR
jgi:hypothetical protein